MTAALLIFGVLILVGAVWGEPTYVPERTTGRITIASGQGFARADWITAGPETLQIVEVIDARALRVGRIAGWTRHRPFPTWRPARVGGEFSPRKDATGD